MAQTPNTLPVTGNVGVGTTSPNTKLEVVGDTKLGGKLEIDSSVVVRDSVTIEKRLTVDQDIKVQGESVFVGDGKFKSDLKVLGVTKLKDKLIIDSTVVMNSDAKIFGDLKIKSLEDPLLTTNRLVSINPNGKLIISSLKLAPNNPGCNYITPWTLGQNNDILLCPIFSSVNIGGNFSVDGTSHLAYLGVGIGNATPITLLDVGGRITMRTGATLGYLPVSDANGTMTWKDPTTIITGGLWQSNSPDIYFNIGNVGIGTTTPEDMLQVGTTNTKLVVGNADGANLDYGTSYLGFNSSRQNGSTWSTSGDGAHNGGAIIYGDISGGIRFSTIPSNGITAQTGVADNDIKTNTRLFIHQDGNVGIGTTAVSGYKLSVEGKVRARSVQVDATNLTWYDNILAKDYPLSSLQEVEEFINKHQHLPNVPSEKEVKENGINLGEMDALLLRKIEELTLYMIALKKDNENLKSELVQLKNK